MSRIFHVRINLDELSSHNDTFGTDAERGEWLRGFLAGARSAPCRFPDASPGQLGHCLGAESLSYAKKFHDQQAAHGAKSAMARREKYGTAQPERPSEGGSNDLQRVVRRSPEGTPNLSNNPIIEEENKPTIQQPKVVDKAPKYKNDADILIAKHPFKISGPKRGHKPVVNEIIKLIGVEEAGKLLSSLEEPLWPDRLMAAANRWNKPPDQQTKPRWAPSAEQRAEIDALLAGGE